MPYSRPTLTQLRDNILEDIAAAQIQNSTGTLLVALLRKAVLRVIAYAQAGLSYEHYEYLDYISLQSVPWTATGEFLDGWAALKGVLREPATATRGTVTFSGVNGTDVPAATPVTRSDGYAFVTASDVITSGGVATVTIQALVAGVAGNFDTNSIFTLANPIGGMQSQSTASAQTVVGTDTETDDSLRTRMLQVYAAPPQGGDRTDYIEWALTAPGVTRAWITPNGMGPGTVLVYVMLDNAEAAHGGFPQGSNGVASAEPRDVAATGDQLVVANVVFPLRPVTALVYVNAPIAQPVAFTIANLGSNNTAPMQASITAALADMFMRLANVGGTVNPVDGTAWPSLDPSAWYSALGTIPGLVNYSVSVPSAPVTPGAGNLLTLGAITFSA